MSISLNEAEEARAANWTIKNVPLRTRLKATTAARKAGKPVWQWLDWAVEVAEAQQGRNTVGPTTAANSSNPEGQPPPDAPLDLDRLIAVADLPLTQWLRRRVNQMLGEALGVEPPKISATLRLRNAQKRLQADAPESRAGDHMT